MITDVPKAGRWVAARANQRLHDLAEEAAAKAGPGRRERASHQRPPCNPPPSSTQHPLTPALRHVRPYSPLYRHQPPGGAPDSPRRPRHAPRCPAAEAHPRRCLDFPRRVQLAFHSRHQRQEGHHCHSQLQEVPLRQRDQQQGLPILHGRRFRWPERARCEEHCPG